MRQLFDPQIPILPITRTINARIAKLKKRFPKFDIYYLVSAAVQERRDVFEQMWQRYEPYADKGFVRQAQLRFHQKTWEIYLGSVLLEKGLILEKTGKNAPDIKVAIPNRPPIWIECVAPERGETQDRVPEMVHGIVQDVPEEQMLLRLKDSFEKKSKQFQKYLAGGVVQKTDARIIAINAGDLQYPEGDPPNIVKTLFALGYLTLRFDPEHKKVIETFWSRREKIKTKSGGEAALGHFLNEQFKDISGVIYSNRTALNRPNEPDAGCIVVLNPFAEVPLQLDDFGFMRKFIGEGNTVHSIAPVSQ